MLFAEIFVLRKLNIYCIRCVGNMWNFLALKLMSAVY